MAARSKMALAIGSSQWIQDEREQAQQFRKADVEEFSYAAINELDWLNEHMAEIFSRDQRYALGSESAWKAQCNSDRRTVTLPMSSRRQANCVERRR